MFRDLYPLVAPRLRADALSNRGLLAGLSVLWRLQTVDRARLHSLRSVTLAPSPWTFIQEWWYMDARDFVAGSSSPAAPSRSSRTVPRTARR
ncbi:MAG: hypothetical protein LLF84_06735 [Methanoregulaceae archaeon]|nr:hypothetical protein [Methanoregulaceae archaeon]